MRPAESRLLDLRELCARDLAPVLESQVSHWRDRFAWDCRAGVQAIHRMLDRRLLHGRALVRAGRPEGYSYFVPEGQTAIVGDLFLCRGTNSGQPEKLLLEGTLNAAALHRGIERVEGQLLYLTQLPSLEPALGGKLSAYPRVLMLRHGPGGSRPPRPARGMRYSSWSDSLLHEASELIAATYQGHVDARISLPYGSVAGARRFLLQTTQQSASGQFFAPAGFVARESGKPALCGLCLGSIVGRGVGHITQLCVAPSARRRGVGSELLRRSLSAFGHAGCGTVSLTVTACNASAIELYGQHGFRTVSTFPAFVWQRG